MRPKAFLSIPILTVLLARCTTSNGGFVRLFGATIVAALFGCATQYSAPELTFSVVDAETNEPIHDATILAAWPLVSGYGNFPVGALMLVDSQSDAKGQV